MANLCANSVTLVGNPERLEMLVEIIKNIGKTCDYISPEDICKKLGIEDDKWGLSYDTAMGSLQNMKFDTISDGYLDFYCSSAWGDIRGAWEAICETCGLDGYTTLSDVDGEYWTVNDPEGIWFPDKYVFDSYGEGTFSDLEMEFYKSKEDLASALNKIADEDRSFEEWVEYMEDNAGEEGGIYEIAREGEQIYPHFKDRLINRVAENNDQESEESYDDPLFNSF